MDIHQLKQRIDASGKENSTNHRPVRFDCSGVGSYQNEVRGFVRNMRQIELALVCL